MHFLIHGDLKYIVYYLKVTFSFFFLIHFVKKFNRKINNFKQNFLSIRQIPWRTIMIDGSNKALKSIRYYLNLFPFSPASPPGNSSAKFVLNKFYALLGSSPFPTTSSPFPLPFPPFSVSLSKMCNM